MGSFALYRWVKNFPIRVIFCLCLFFATLGEAQPLNYTWVRGAGSGSDQEASAVTADLSGNVYVTGYIKGANNNFSSILLSSVGNDDIFIAKYDQDGNILWAKAAGGSGNDKGNSIAVDNSGNVYVCGRIDDNATFFGSPNITVSGVGSDIFIAKFNSSGNVLWVKRQNSTSDGVAYAICTNGTEVFVTGQFAATLNFGLLPALTSSGGYDAFIASVDCSNGAENWAIKGGSSSDDNGTGIAVDASGVYVTGGFESTLTFQNMAGTLTNSGNFDVFVVKYGFAGNGIWKRKAGGSGDERETSVAVSGSYVYVAGHFSGTMSLFNTGPAVATITANASDDSFISQWDATTGNFGWIRSENGTGQDRATGVAASPIGDVFVVGYFQGQLPFGSGPSVNANANDIFVTKYNATGVFQWGKKVIGSNDDFGYGIVAPDNTSAYVVGSFKSGTATFDAQSISNISNFDIFTAKLGCIVTISDAGLDQTICTAATATLAGNTPVTGTGAWTLISGTGTITNPSSPTSTVTGLTLGTHVFRWTITNAACPATSFDQVTITVDANPTTANAGADQSVCSSTTTLAGNSPTIGTGTWTRLSGSGIASSPNSPTSAVTGLTTGSSVYQWSITNGVCPASTDVVTLTRDQNPTISNAGSDQSVCSNTATLAGNVPAIGTGMWTLISGTGVVTSPSTNNSAVNGLSVGANVFRWTISNGSCPSSTDEITITVDPNPTVSNAGPDQSVCSGSATLAGNTD